MKKVPLKGRGYFTARARLAQRAAWSRERARVKRGGKPRVNFVRVGKLVTLVIAAPSELSVSNPDARTATVDFLEKLRRHTEGGGVKLIVDLSQLDRILPSGAVLLVAEMDRAISRPNGVKYLSLRRPKASVADQVMQQLGVYEKFGLSSDKPPSHDSVIHWRAATGVISDGVTGGSILLDYEGRLADGLTRGLYDGVVEAMTNTVHHAYHGTLGDRLRHGIGRRWWMLSQEKDGLLTVAICDLGIGIPRSLPRSRTFSIRDVKSLWRKLGLNPTDASAIQVAIKLGETRTGQSGRGKGLADIIEAVNLSDRGGVFISSNRGVYTCAPGEKHVTANATHSIHGTLIHWAVPVTSSSDEQPGEN